MSLTNTTKRYGWISIGLHWVIAIVIIGTFSLGLWMVDLDYYSTWYHDAPAIHKSIGVCLVGLMLIRLLWLWANPTVGPIERHSKLITLAARSVHRLFYILVFSLGISGYLISTAEGQGIDIFDWFTLPALLPEIEDQADRAGEVHYWIAISLIGLTILHFLAALKHHFIDKDETLKRMLKGV